MYQMYEPSDRRCQSCAQRRNTVLHFRACVPKRHWPADLGKPREVQGIECDCGQSFKDQRGLRLHRMRAAVHREVLSA